MMLLTVAFVPASWAAMLPQKFSAATTWKWAWPGLDPAAAGDPELPHPASATATTAAARAGLGAKDGLDTALAPPLSAGRGGWAGDQGRSPGREETNINEI